MRPPLQNYRITLDQIRMAKRALKGKKSVNPCAIYLEKITNAMPSAEYNIRPLWKYVKDAEKCIDYHMAQDRTKGKPSTPYYLSQYLDQEKHKRK